MGISPLIIRYKLTVGSAQAHSHTAGACAVPRWRRRHQFQRQAPWPLPGRITSAGSQAWRQDNSAAGHSLPPSLKNEGRSEDSRKTCGNLSLQHKYICSGQCSRGRCSNPGSLWGFEHRDKASLDCRRQSTTDSAGFTGISKGCGPLAVACGAVPGSISKLGVNATIRPRS